MNRKSITLTAAIAAIFAAVALAQQPTATKVAYPEGYRDWTHVKSMVLQPGHPLFDSFGGIHHVYANASALKALRNKSAYPDGAVFAFDLLEAQGDSTAVTEGGRKVLGVMEKNAKAFAATGGWGFEAFKANTKERVVTDGGASCFSCHDTNAKSSGYVFTQWRD